MNVKFLFNTTIGIRVTSLVIHTMNWLRLSITILITIGRNFHNLKSLIMTNYSQVWPQVLNMVLKRSTGLNMEDQKKQRRSISKHNFAVPTSFHAVRRIKNKIQLLF